MKESTILPHSLEAQYDSVFHRVAGVVDAARQSAARSVNAFMTAAYWMIGRHVMEFEQQGKQRADYGEAIIERLAADLSARYGRGFFGAKRLADESILRGVADSAHTVCGIGPRRRDSADGVCRILAD